MLEVYQKCLPENQLHLVTDYNNIGVAYKRKGEYLKALSFYERANNICEQQLPENHPTIGINYNNMGGLYYAIGDRLKALLYGERVEKILQISYPSNHPMLQQLRQKLTELRWHHQ